MSVATLSPFRNSLLCALASAACALLLAASAQADDLVPGEVVVREKGAPAKVLRGVPDVGAAVARLQREDDVVYAAPNPIAHAAAFTPNDPGNGTGWAEVQWNFLSEWGVNAPDAWQHAIDAGVPGGRGIRIAVLDSGVAYANRGEFRRSPDLDQTRFEAGYDFVDDDPYPNDENGHGTHVVSTIAESTNNGKGLTGLAYGATIVPVRVLDEKGEGDSDRIARAVRWAVKQDVDLINLSLEFGTEVPASLIPSLLDALAYARKKGVLVIGAAGNEGEKLLSFPARSSNVLAVGATTEHGCLSSYSNLGRGLDMVAPGGGKDAFTDDPHCQPDATPGRSIVQLTLFPSKQTKQFGYSRSYFGTSMAVPHVTATAALILATKLLGTNPTPTQIIARLKGTSRDLGAVGPDRAYGAGLVDAAAATDPARTIPPAVASATRTKGT